MNKYFRETKFDSGETVWDMYENGSLKAIENRTRQEVFFTHKCYMKIHSDIASYKNLEQKEIIRKELEKNLKINIA